MRVGTEERLERMGPGPARAELWPLLLLADDSEQQVHSYYQLGDLFVLRAIGRQPHAITLVIPQSGQCVELKAVAVAPALHRQGIGTRMLALVLAELRAAGVRQVTVGTGNSGIGQLAFYQKAGFRLSRIERDFFTHERGYPDGLQDHGIPCRDMVWMEQEL